MGGKYEILAEKLSEAGCKYAFGISGSGPSYELITELIKREIKYLPVSNESAGAIAAGVCAYLDRKPAVSVSIKGPGFVNMLSGIGAAYLEKYPLLAIAEEYHSMAPPTKMHKRMEQLQMVKPLISKSGSLNTMDCLTDFLQFDAGNEQPHYFSLAELDIPKDPLPSEINTYNGLSSEIIEKINSAKKPVLIIGSLVYRLGFEEALSFIRLPIFTTVQAKGLIDESLENACGIFTGVGLKYAPESSILDEADLIISLGLRNYELLGPDKKETFLNLDIPNHSPDPHTLYLSLPEMGKVLDILKKKENWAKHLIEDTRQLLNNFLRKHDWMPANAFEKISSLKYDHGLVLDTGTFCTIGEHAWEAIKGRCFIGSSNGRNMGISIPSAFGMSIARPGLPVFCVCGDGGIRYHLGEIRTIVEMNLPVCIILMTDGQYGSIITSLKNKSLKNKIATPLGTSWKTTFEGMGIKSHLAVSAESFSRAIDSWDHSSTLFIEASFEPETYLGLAENLRA